MDAKYCWLLPILLWMLVTGANCQCSRVQLRGTDTHGPIEGYYVRTTLRCTGVTSGAIYERSGGYYLYFDFDLTWNVADVACSMYVYLTVKDLAMYPEDITATWDEATWIDFAPNPDVKVTCAPYPTPPPPTTIPGGCTRVRLTGTDTHQGTEGYYIQTSGKCSTNRHIYEHTQQDYYMYHSSTTWSVSDHACDDWVFLNAADSAEYPELIRSVWQEATSTDWQFNSRITVTCAPTGGAAANHPMTETVALQACVLVCSFVIYGMD